MIRGHYYTAPHLSRLSHVTVQPAAATLTGLVAVRGCCRHGTRDLCGPQHPEASPDACSSRNGDTCAASASLGPDAAALPGNVSWWPDERKIGCPTPVDLHPQVASFWPRRGLRSGAGTLTVVGKHFGLAGTSPVVRLGQATALCRHPVEDYTQGNAPVSG